MSNYLISYDIHSDRIRVKVAKRLIQFGCRRLQKSVFLAEDFSREDLRELAKAVRKLFPKVVRGSDSIVCIQVQEAQLRKKGVFGSLSKEILPEEKPGARFL